MTAARSLTRVDRFLSRTAAIATPFYQEFPPPADLRAFIACTWVRLVRQPRGGTTHAILPDGCADIMVYDDQPPRVAGPDAVTRWVTIGDGVAITGIRIRPGACRAVLGCPANRLVNGSMLLSDLAPGATDLHRRLLMSGDPAGHMALLEGWVRAALDRATAKDRTVIEACRMLSSNSKVSVDDVARRLDWNARTIHRQFIAGCGYGPKHFQRIMRMQAVLQAAQTATSPRLGELAAAAGYSDQAHMTRDFRDITGFTPAAYFASAAAPGWGAWIGEGW